MRTLRSRLYRLFAMLACVSLVSCPAAPSLYAASLQLAAPAGTFNASLVQPAPSGAA